MRFEKDAPKPQLKKPKDWLMLYLQGICMGASDIVPGISGGTMAFIMGIYENLLISINSINLRSLTSLATLKISTFSKEVAWEFLSALIFGILTSFIFLANLIHHILNQPLEREYLYGLFFGLIIASVFFCSKQVKKWTPLRYAGLMSGAFFAFMLTEMEELHIFPERTFDVPLSKPIPNDKTIPIANVSADGAKLIAIPENIVSTMIHRGLISEKEALLDSRNREPATPKKASPNPISPWLIFCGGIAIIALLLPGISGSYMLTVLGVYPLAIGAIADLSSGLGHLYIEWDAFFILFSLLIGIAVGGVLFSRIVYWLLRHYHDMTIAVMTGFMIGSIKTVWPFWNYQYFINPLKIDKGLLLKPLQAIMPYPDTHFWLVMGCVIAGFMLVNAIEWIAHRKKARR